MSSREQFEAWMKDAMPGCDLSTGNHTAYNNSSTHWLYCAWVASRAALVIELPSRVGYENRYDEIEMSSLEPDHDKNSDEAFALVRAIEVIEAIEAAGVRVKP